MITEPQVAAITGDAATWFVPLRAAAWRWEINTPLRLAHWLAQCAHESTDFTRLVESMHYSAGRLLAVFPTHFTTQEAADFAFNDASIAERVYGGRMGNRKEGSGDGWKYRGRGLLQITGANNYGACGQALGYDLVSLPELLEQPIFAADSAGWYWAKHGCNELADADDIVGTTRAINGGQNGIDARRRLLTTAKEVLA